MQRIMPNLTALQLYLNQNSKTLQDKLLCNTGSSGCIILGYFNLQLSAWGVMRISMIDMGTG